MPCQRDEFNQVRCWESMPGTHRDRYERGTIEGNGGPTFDNYGAAMMYTLRNDPPLTGFGLLIAVIVAYVGVKLYNSSNRRRGGDGFPGFPPPPKYRPLDQDGWDRR